MWGNSRQYIPGSSTDLLTTAESLRFGGSESENFFYDKREGKFLESPVNSVTNHFEA